MHKPGLVMPDEALVLLACVVTYVVLVCRARAIGYRQHNREAVGGFFSQIGNLYMVHHLWGMDKYQLFAQLNTDCVTTLIIVLMLKSFGSPQKINPIQV